MNSEIKHKTQWSTIVRPLVVLIFLTVVTQLGSLAYTVDKSFLSILGPSLLAICALTFPPVAIGLFLGPRIGLGAPLLTSFLSREPTSGRKLYADSRLAIGLGLGVGVVMLALNLLLKSYLPAELPALGHRGAIGGLLVSINAAVSEEIWMRLGLLTLLAWIFVRLLKHTKLHPSVAWPIIVVSAIVFGMIHLPQLAAAGAASPLGIVGVVLGNTVVGTFYGWLYWRRSLIAAMLGHFAVDIVLHVFTAFV